MLSFFLKRAKKTFQEGALEIIFFIFLFCFGLM